jgi:tetratricopeptide (TPR) repeat protein
MQIFISHTHGDVGLVDAFRDLVGGIFDDEVTLRYSSSSRLGEGIAPGMDWLSWIQEQVRQSDLTIVLLTSESIHKPWVLWETGAVTGVSLASPPAREPEQRPTVVPLLMGIDAEQIPSPLRALQATYGDGPGIEPLVTVINALGSRIRERQLKQLFDANLDPYLRRVEAVLRERPLPLDEAAVAEWIDRLDGLRRQKRSAEVGHHHAAMLRAFAAEGRGEGARLDVRLHRRLGEMYLEGGRPELAAQELAKAVALTRGRDLYLLHRLGMAQLDAKRLDQAQATLEAIEAVGGDATRIDPEVAGLKARYHRELWKRDQVRADLVRARDAYRDALDASERVGNRSYYLADNVGQLSLMLGDRDQARAAFQRARDFIAGSTERSVWSYATLASACFAVGEQAEGLRALASVRAQDPDPRTVRSIEEGLGRLRDGLEVEPTVFEGWIATLHGRAA